MHNWPYIIDGSIVVLYLIGCLIFGFYKRQNIKSIREYAIGKGSISIFTLVCTLFATDVGAGFIMGGVTKVYNMGFIFIIAILFSFMPYLIDSYIYPSSIRRFSGCISISDVMEKMYGKFGGEVTNFVNLLVGVGVMAGQIMAMGFLIEYFFHLQKIYGVMIGTGILVSYSLFGGVRAVVFTDILQFLIFYIGIPLGCIFMLKDVLNSYPDGVKGALATLPKNYIFFDFSFENCRLLLSLIFYYAFIPRGISSVFIQRYLMVHNPQKLKSALRITCLVSIPFVFFLCLIGILVKIKVPDQDSNQAFTYFVENYMPVGIRGLMIAGLLAVMMSTADSWVNSSAVLVYRMHKKYFGDGTDAANMKVVRVATFMLASLSISLALWANDIMQMIWLIDNFFEPLILVPIVVGFLGFKTNEFSFKIATFTAMLFTFTAAFLNQSFGTVSMICGVSGSAIGLFFAYIWQKKAWNNLDEDTANNKYINKVSQQLQTTWLTGINGSKIKIFGFFLGFYSLVYLLVFCITLKSSSNFAGIDFTIAATCYCFSFILIFRDKFQKSALILKMITPISYIALFLCLSLIPFYLLLSSNDIIPNIIYLALSSVLLYFFLNLREGLILTICGIIVAYYINSYIASSSNTLQNSQLATYVSSILTIAILLYQKWRETKDKEKLLNNQLYGGALAHELRSPLSMTKMVAGMMDGILNNERLSKTDIETMKRTVKKLDKSVSHGLASIEAILQEINNDNTNEDHNQMAHDIYQCAAEALEYCRNTIGIKATIDLKSENNFEFYGTKMMIIHLIANMVLNSIKHGKANYVRIWFEPNNEMHIADNGSGIEEEKIANIFDDFYTLNPENGTGIGLAFCRRVIEKFGGSVSYLSLKNRKNRSAKISGAHFIIQF